MGYWWLHGFTSVTRGYRELLRVLRGEKRFLGCFEEVTGGSQRVTKGYWKLQGVTGSYKGLQVFTYRYDGLPTVRGHF